MTPSRISRAVLGSSAQVFCTLNHPVSPRIALLLRSVIDQTKHGLSEVLLSTWLLYHCRQLSEEKVAFPSLQLYHCCTFTCIPFLLRCFFPSHPLLHCCSAPASVDTQCATAAITNHLWSPRSELESVSFFSLSKKWG